MLLAVKQVCLQLFSKVTGHAFVVGKIKLNQKFKNIKNKIETISRLKYLFQIGYDLSCNVM